MRHSNRGSAGARRVGILFSLFCIALLSAGCCLPRHASAPAHEAIPAVLDRAQVPAEQAVVVIAEGHGTRARLYALERLDGHWRERLGPVPALLGRNGLAEPGEKREGDGRTPSGLFPLESVFGYAPHAATRMPYRQATENDLWVDDVNSPDYNTWVRRGETSAKSFETMRLRDDRYRHGVVIGYNRNPIVQGKGSAIFLHAWLNEATATSGCVAMDENELVRLIEWLDPARKPLILIATEENLPAIAAGKGSAP